MWKKSFVNLYTRQHSILCISREILCLSIISWLSQTIILVSIDNRLALNIVKSAFRHFGLASGNIIVSLIKRAMQNRVLVVTGKPSELLMEQHPRDRHPWHGSVPRIEDQKSAEFETQRIRDGQETRTSDNGKRRSIDRTTRRNPPWKLINALNLQRNSFTLH